MGSKYSVLIRFLLGIILFGLGINQFFSFLNSDALLVLNSSKIFYGILFFTSSISILSKKAIPVTLIILLFFATQAFFYFLENNPSHLISPIGIVALLVVLNIAEHKDRFKGLFL